jgi:hypothetical protein
VRDAARREEAAERLSAEYQSKLLLLQRKENLELAKDSLTSRRKAAKATTATTAAVSTAAATAAAGDAGGANSEIEDPSTVCICLAVYC